jgi:hypothetical protein
LSPRATHDEVWAALESATCYFKSDLARREKIAAYIVQAKAYFLSTVQATPVTKPLTAYYCALSLAKAYLLWNGLSDSQKCWRSHGLSDVTGETAAECMKVKKTGIFRELACSTGRGFCYKENAMLELDRLLAYLPEGYDAYIDAKGEHPRLVPLCSIEVLGSRTHREVWLRITIERGVLDQRKLGPERLLSQAKAFSEKFRLVSVPKAREDGKGYGWLRGAARAIYESEPVKYDKRLTTSAISALIGLYEGALIACDRTFPGGRYYVVLSDRVDLLSHEAVAFAVLHHLSNVVRYRPDAGKRMASSNTHGWLFSRWIDRALENFTMSIASRITGEHHVFV